MSQPEGGVIDVDELVERFRHNALFLINSSEFWEIRVHGGNGKARIELIQQTEPVPYRHAAKQRIIAKTSKLSP